MPRRLLLLLVIAFVAGCSNDTPALAPTPETPAPQVEAPATESEPAVSAHALAADAEYYLDGPQQSRPPDGTLKAGTKVMVIEDAGSYCRVRSEDGILAFIATNAIKAANDAGPQAAHDPALGNGGKPEGD